MIFLLGRQAMLGQEPPIYFRSMTTARIPFLARVQAMYLPASPLPSTTTSYSSGGDIGVCMGSVNYLGTKNGFQHVPITGAQSSEELIGDFSIDGSHRQDSFDRSAFENRLVRSSGTGRALKAGSFRFVSAKGNRISGPQQS